MNLVLVVVVKNIRSVVQVNKMSKKETTKYSDAGKGDKSRVSDKKKFDDNWEKIFGRNKNEKKGKKTKITNRQHNN